MIMRMRERPDGQLEPIVPSYVRMRNEHRATDTILATIHHAREREPVIAEPVIVEPIETLSLTTQAMLRRDALAIVSQNPGQYGVGAGRSLFEAADELYVYMVQGTHPATVMPVSGLESDTQVEEIAVAPVPGLETTGNSIHDTRLEQLETLHQEVGRHVKRWQTFLGAHTPAKGQEMRLSTKCQIAVYEGLVNRLKPLLDQVTAGGTS